ncbi:hypothetical protein DY000_02033862 [Brassica cretica]|uniref:Uncharacterized protein n=1 Tax=Brassica cretica TaxID=69181 RepID=A0ABQ7DQ90_BRACR|nr:hypothetical protein DY000_02033862 [Brassica cretica]
MGRNDQHKIQAEKQELAKQETVRHGKHLTSVSTTGGTSRQQALAAKKRDGKQVVTAEGVDASSRKSASSKRSTEPEGKGVALPQVEENEDITEEDQTPLKKSKVSKGKKIHGKVYYMTFKEIGQALGLKDLEESSIPIPYDALRRRTLPKWFGRCWRGRLARPAATRTPPFAILPCAISTGWLSTPFSKGKNQALLMMRSYNFFTKPSNIMLTHLSCLLSALISTRILEWWDSL